MNYIIVVRGSHKLFYINMLKKYYSWAEDQVEATLTNTPSSVRHANTVSAIENVDKETCDAGFPKGIPYPILKQSESW